VNKELLDEWLIAKDKENEAKKDRQKIEDLITSELELDECGEGSKTHNVDNYQIKVTQRLSRKVDSDKLQEIAAQEGTTDHLSTLFRWKAEVDKKIWDSVEDSITGPLSHAITVKAGRPSYNILLK